MGKKTSGRSGKVETVKRICQCCQQEVERPACAKHPGNPAESCRYCDLCEHGTPSSAHCEACHVNDDPAWKTAPVTDREIAQLRRWFSEYDAQYVGPHQAVRRYTPYGKRNFRDTEVSFVPLLLNEFVQLRARASEVNT